MKSNRILIIGAFGYNTKNIGGQTIKTRNVYEILRTKYTVSYIDTDDLKKNIFLILKLILECVKHKHIYYAGGQSNLKYIFPLIVLLAKLRGASIVYVTVGGWLYDFLQANNSLYTFLVNQCKGILVETSYLKASLKSMGLEQAEVIPNFRIVSQPIRQLANESDTLNLVFMARVVKEKGIFIILEAIEKLQNDESFKFKITFYGPIDKKDKKQFFEKLNKHRDVACYEGVLNPNDIYSHLARHDVLLLPTFHPGEGFPGTILDAYISGIPVITTKWKQIPEFVDDGETGFLIEYDVEQLVDKIVLLAKEPSLLAHMKDNAFKKSEEYSSEKGLQILEQAMFES